MTSSTKFEKGNTSSDHLSKDKFPVLNTNSDSIYKYSEIHKLEIDIEEFLIDLIMCQNKHEKYFFYQFPIPP
jgi:hypothetical protein